MIKTTLHLIFSLAMIVIFGISSGQTAQAQTSSLVGQSTSGLATQGNAQRKVVFDSVAGLYWAFYYNGTTIFYYTSPDAQTWTNAGTLSNASIDFSVTYKAISGTGYIFIALHENGSHDITVLRGTLSGPTIVFDTPIIALDGSSLEDTYSSPSIAVTADDTLWIAAVHGTDLALADNREVRVTRALSALTSPLSGFTTGQQVGPRSSSLLDIALVPRTLGELYLVVNGEGHNITGYRYDGVSWLRASQGGDFSWFNFPGSSLNGNVNAIAVYGGFLYIGGDFLDAGGDLNADYIARFENGHWSSVGTFNGQVRALTVGASILYAGGDFTDANGGANNDYLAAYDGSTWTTLGTGLTGAVHAIETSASLVYVGGAFTDAGGVTNADRLALWNGSSWEALGLGVDNGIVKAIEFGSFLYVGGTFSSVSGLSFTNGVAAYTGSSWLGLGTGVSGSVNALLLDGTNLYVGGSFTSAGGMSNTSNIALWDTSMFSWGALGTGTDGAVNALALSGTDLFAGGSFSSAGGVTGATKIARWSTIGLTWSVASTALNGDVRALYNDSVLLVGGAFTNADNDPSADKIASYDGSMWLGYEQVGTFNAPVLAMTLYNNELYVGGEFTDVVGDTTIDYLAVWDGNTWSRAGTVSATGPVKALAVHGSELYAGGDFLDFSGNSLSDYIARFNGIIWQPLSTSGLNGEVLALTSLGSILYVGGQFTDAGGVVNADGVAGWDGSTWSALGTGVAVSPEVYYVSALTRQGADLYVGGSFLDAGGASNTSNIARWDTAGNTWHALSTGVNGIVYALTASATDVYAGGDFVDAGGVTDADKIARWSIGSATWNALGTGLNNTVRALNFDSGLLYVGGLFTNAGGNSAADWLAVFDGSSWLPLDNGPNEAVLAIGEYQGELYIGGSFQAVNGFQSPHFAKFGEVIAPDIILSKISASSDNSGNVYVLYLDVSNSLYFRRYSGATWASPILISNGSIGSHGISVTATGGEIAASYERSGSIYSRKLYTPFLAPNLLIETTHDSSPFNALVTIAERNGGSRYVGLWTQGASPPYSVFSAQASSVSSLSGTVTLSVGGPLFGVGINGGAFGTRLTDASGNYAYTGIDNGTTYSITPGLFGYTFSPSTATGSITGDTDLDFIATPNPHTVSGTVFSAGVPVSGVTVTAQGIGSVTTDSSGAYSFTIPYGTTYSISASRPKYTIVPAAHTGTVTGDTTLLFAATPNSFTISGEVKTTAGKPVPGVTVSSNELGSTTTNTSGVFTYATVLEDAPYTITVGRTGFTFNQTQVSGTATANTTHSFVANADTYTISGSVTENGAPLSGVTVQAGVLGSTTTDASGRYSFAGVSHGALYTLRVSRSGYQMTPSSASGTVTSATTHNFTATASSFTLSGIVTLRGKALEGVVIDGGALGKKTTKKDGKFTYSGITPGTEFSLVPTLTGYTFSPVGVAGVLTKDTTVTLRVATKASYGSDIERASIASDGTEGNAASDEAVLSGDSSFVIFSSTASSLDENDTNAKRDVFIRSLATAGTKRISISGKDEEGNGDSGVPLSGERSLCIASDGVFAAFTSSATNLVVDDLNAATDIFLYSNATDSLTLISASTEGAQADGESFGPSMSSAGSKVVFTSRATNLVSGDTNGVADIFVKTISGGALSRVSVAADGTQANGASRGAVISGDGTVVAFVSDATNLVAGDTNGVADIFIKNLTSGAITRVSVATDGTAANGASSIAAINSDGTVIAFQSDATNLVSGDTNGVADVFVRNVTAQTTTRVSVNSSSVQGDAASGTHLGLSADGRYVLFSSASTTLVSGHTGTVSDVFVHDRTTGRTGLISRKENGTQTNGTSLGGSISLDGKHFAFVSDATDLVSDDTNRAYDVFTALLPDLPIGFKPNARIEQPPVLVVDSKSVTIVMQLFFIPTSTTQSLSREETTAAKETIRYNVTVQNNRRKSDVKRTTSKRNTLTVRGLKPGNYSVKYSAQKVKSGKVVASTKTSPKRSFTIR
jgi:hypothetical protein